VASFAMEENEDYVRLPLMPEWLPITRHSHEYIWISLEVVCPYPLKHDTPEHHYGVNSWMPGKYPDFFKYHDKIQFRQEATVQVSCEIAEESRKKREEDLQKMHPEVAERLYEREKERKRRKEEFEK